MAKRIDSEEMQQKILSEFHYLPMKVSDEDLRADIRLTAKELNPTIEVTISIRSNGSFREIKTHFFGNDDLGAAFQGVANNTYPLA